MTELLSMEQAMTEIVRLTDKAAKLDKLCAELWCKNDKLTKECADLTNLNVIQARQLVRKDRYLARYHDSWEVAAIRAELHRRLCSRKDKRAVRGPNLQNGKTFSSSRQWIKTMWILPKNYPLSSAFAQDMVASNEDLTLPRLNIESSLMSRSKPMPQTAARAWEILLSRLQIN
jgi:hypothetical protein